MSRFGKWTVSGVIRVSCIITLVYANVIVACAAMYEL